MASPRTQMHDEIAQAAWLYYVGQKSQEEVASQLGISRYKVLRMLADARDQGLVRISVEHRTAGTLELADALAEAFGLAEAQVAPVPASFADNAAFARSAVAILGAAYLGRLARSDQPMTIGLGWGRTLSQMADGVTRVTNPGLTFVSLMGSVARATHTAPGDVCVRLAEITGGQAILMPAPFMTDDAGACQQVMQQRLVREALDAARQAAHALVSVGECRDGAVLFESDLFTAAQKDELVAAEVVGDCCGVFYRADGTVADIEVNRCTPCITAAEMARIDTVVFSSGAAKLRATLAVVRAGVARRLMVDETLARLLLSHKDA